jgi:hypothetical protein
MGRYPSAAAFKLLAQNEGHGHDIAPVVGPSRSAA